MSYKALIVDFGGVLTTPLQDSLVAFAQAEGIDIQDLVRAALAAYAGGEDDLVVRFETGRIEESEFVQHFAQRLEEISGKKVDPDNLVGRLLAGLKLEAEMIDLLRRAKDNGFKTALLSNSWGTTSYPMDLLNEVCDVIVISGEVGMRKPDRDIFDFTLKELDVPAEGCIFVDDHPGHLKTAMEIGMTTVLHRDPDRSVAEVGGLLGI
jgi:putative hydrolase of the HAD superfamily